MRKNIVLLSDGTGNSAASPFKTNVWRLYQALDIAPPTADSNLLQQIVYYDNGVGTENFKPLAALGGALGIGVWQNVKDIYTFVCRNYDLGDQLYGFGFSRGAFTIRLVMGLIGKCGIVKTRPHSEAKLREAIEMAYEAYRRDFLLRASRLNGMIYHWVLREPRYLFDDAGHQTNLIDLTNGKDDTIIQHFIDIPFLGVWDTVDAYGMPVDELKSAIDEWVWPMSFADRDPSKRIRVIRHALSLDDERPTFRPVLWNEMVQDQEHPDDPKARIWLGCDRIQQVWFAGVHANVGGGYPDDGLAYVALDWMMNEAAVCGLRFFTHPRSEVAWRVDPHGEQYDSRAGVAGYYRYGPRDAKLLCDDKEHGVRVPTIWMHVDAFDRVARHQRAYASVSLNERFDLIGGMEEHYPPPAFLTAELARLEQAWDIVWWRRLAYFGTLATTIFLALFFAALVVDWPNSILAGAEGILSALGGARIGEGIAWLIQQGSSVFALILPSWAVSAMPSFSKYPLTALVSLALLATLFLWASDALQRRIEAHAEWAWGSQKGLPLEGAPEPNWLNAIARPGRKITGWLYRRLWRGLVVYAVGICLGVVVLVLASPYWIFRVFRRRPWMA
jgi:uncharacterized protein (DUF2235 family)